MAELRVRQVFILFVFLIQGSETRAQPILGKYPIHHFTPSIYQAGNQNIDFAQNRDMSLFVANNLGVLSYNGKDWSKHAFGTGKKMRALAFDKGTNTLYVGSQGEFGFFRDNWEYESLNDKVPRAFADFDEVWDVFIYDDRVYFCTFQGIYAFDGQSIHVISSDSGLARSFHINGQLFTQNQQGELFEILDQGLVSTYRQSQNNQIISGIITHSSGLLLFYNSGQIELSSTIGAQPIYTDLIRELKGTYVNHVLRLSDNRIAISTQTSGLFLYHPQSGIIENITTLDGLASNACLRAFQDYSGKLWLGLQSGISLIDINSPMRLINKEINLQGSGYQGYQTNSGFYFTTSNGIYYKPNDKNSSEFLKGTEGPSYGLQLIEGKLYAGHHTGLFLLENDGAIRIAMTDGLWGVKQLQSNPRYVLGGGYAGLHLFELNAQQELKYLNRIRGFDESSRFFEEDRQGSIWVGQYYKGLYKLSFSADYTGVEVQDFTQKEGYSDYEQIVMSKVNNDIMIAAKTGIFKLDQSNGSIIDSEIFSDEFENEQVYIFEQDNQKNVHVVSENTVGYFQQIGPGNYVFSPSSLHYSRYRLNNDLLNISTNTKNGILLSSNEGFIFYDPKLESKIDLNQPLTISQVYSVSQDSILYQIGPFEHLAEELDGIEVSFKDKLLQFDVESFQFNGGYNQEFRYFLMGFDDSYTDWVTTSTKEYSNLKEGNYEFIVQTRNHLGEITTSQPLVLHVKPPFYRSTFTKTLYFVLSLLVLYLLFKYQSQRYKKKTKKIKKIGEQELWELEQKKERELSKLQEEKLESELRHVNNLLAASTMNLVVKNEFIESIKEELKEVKLLGRNNRTKQALEGIVKEIDSTLRLQQDWEQFKLHFDKVHGDFLNRLREEYVDLSPNEQKLCALLRLNLNTKEISNLMSISLRGVEVARYRLRKKLKLQKGMNLSKFILDY